MKIIGLLGAAGSGKSTVSDYLVAKYDAKKYSFAYPLKEIARRVFDFTEGQLYGSQAEKEAVDPRYNFSPRWLLQKLGTEGIRAVLGEDTWWQSCLRRILDDRPSLVVIEDFRFSNEVDGFLGINDAAWIDVSVDWYDRLRECYPFVPNVDGNPIMPPVLPVNVWRIEAPGPSVSEADSTHQSEAEWSRCRYTNILKPERRGLVELFDAVDEAAYLAGLQPAHAVLR